ncbi:hypothetical protein FHZ96_00500 [Listeria monocytogenes]|nr:hypothetical protein [Listeria monocytogenes]EAD1221452.1 hypothetical protein [Listeria monocytogenes]EAD6004487.1 hypothetical protein [Listeria monocytogenes]EAD6102348.1 hypothetical protein [Listeria monocytogenes]EAD6123663.1 hypothetical protein [Listeria monocytogenes]
MQYLCLCFNFSTPNNLGIIVLKIYTLNTSSLILLKTKSYLQYRHLPFFSINSTKKECHFSHSL